MSLDRCPTCKARYRRGESCRRCGMELVWLLRIKQNAQQIKQQLIHVLTEQDYKQAKVLVKQHQQLVADATIDHIGMFVNAQILSKQKQHQ